MSDFRFERLAVWQKAIDFADLIYDVTCNYLLDEKFGLTSQMRRAAVSISSNVAEGSSRTSDADFARFVEIAYGSAMEVMSQAVLSARRKLLSTGDLDQIREQTLELSRMLSGLRASLKT